MRQSRTRRSGMRQPGIQTAAPPRAQPTSTQLIDPPPSPVRAPSALFHTGLVVEDLEAATASLSALAGYHWTSVMELEVAPRTEAGVTRFPQRFVLSLEEPRLELVEAIPG